MKKLGRPTNQRMAMLKSQVSALLWFGKLETTEDRAKEIKRLAEKYITLAININGLMDTIKDEIGTLIATPVDEIVELVTAGVTVLPTEYEWDETAQAFVDGADVTADLLIEIMDLCEEAMDEFGMSGFMALLAEYGVDSVSGTPIIVNVLSDISEKYDALIEIRDEVVIADIIGLIDAAVATAPKAKEAVEE